MPHTARASLFALATLLAASQGARAQCSGGRVSRFDAFTVTPIALQLPAANAAAFNAGWSVSSYSILVDPSQNNRQWYLCVLALTPNLGTVSGYTKPLADMQWSTDGATWTSVAFLSLQPIVNNRGRRTITLFVRSLLTYANDVAQSDGSSATYAANLRFQVSM